MGDIGFFVVGKYDNCYRGHSVTSAALEKYISNSRPVLRMFIAQKPALIAKRRTGLRGVVTKRKCLAIARSNSFLVRVPNVVLCTGDNPARFDRLTRPGIEKKLRCSGGVMNTSRSFSILATIPE